MFTKLEIASIAVTALFMFTISTLSGCTIGPKFSVVKQEYCERDDYGKVCRGSNNPETNMDWLIREHNRRVNND